MDFIRKHIIELENELEEEKRKNRILEGQIKKLRTRCREEARDMFDRGNYGTLVITAKGNVKY